VVVFTPGHTLGHMSVVLRTAKGEVLVAGDAIFMHRTLDDDHLPHLVADEHLFRRSMREIRQYRKETPGRARHPGARLGRLAEARRELLSDDSSRPCPRSSARSRGS
jgi:glyoxylase-like metal-dependent hydrolase (beta-lactamase superfamily II)